MKKWKIACGSLFTIIIFLIVILVWQDQHVKRELLKDYILHHSSVEQSLGIAIDEYEQSLEAQQLSDTLITTYGASMIVFSKPPNLYRLMGTQYFGSVDYLFEVRDQFDFYLPAAVHNTIEDSRDGDLTEMQYQKLLSYYQLLQEFNELTITDDFGEKKVADFEKDFETFYLNNEEEISALIN